MAAGTLCGPGAPVCMGLGAGALGGAGGVIGQAWGESPGFNNTVNGYIDGANSVMSGPGYFGF